MLLHWAETISEGMLPDRFPTAGETPEFDSVDASLWYVVTVYELLQAVAKSGRALQHESESRLWEAVQAILTRYAEGTRHGIHADADGLLAAEKSEDALIATDAKGDSAERRIGKPVDLQALWLNSLWIGGRVAERWQRLFERALVSFRTRFWNAERRCLYDIVDWDNEAGRVDARVRPSQVYAVGGLPVALLDAGSARQMVETVEAELWTPLGLRSLAPGVRRDTTAEGATSPASGTESGTAWPHLAAAFIEAWVRVHDSTPQAKAEARARFLEPLLQHLTEAGIGHVSECADAEPPFTPRGRPFQAGALGDLLRVQELALAARQAPVSGASPGSLQTGRIQASDAAP